MSKHTDSISAVSVCLAQGQNSAACGQAQAVMLRQLMFRISSLVYLVCLLVSALFQFLPHIS